MDNLADEFLLSIDKSNNFHEPLNFPSQQVSLIVENQHVATNIEEEQIAGYYCDDIIKHYQDVVKVPSQASDNVQWHSLKLALHSNKNKNAVMKALHSQWQTMRVCHKWRLSNSAECPLCLQNNETWSHVLQCPNIHVSRVRTEQIYKLSKDLHHLQTNSTLQKHIMHIVERWTASKPIDVPTLSFTFPAIQLRKAHNEQIQNGIFFKGIISKKWGQIHEEDYRRHHMPAKYNRIPWKKNE